MKTSKHTIKETPPMYETENDLPKVERTELNSLINQRLADLVDLQMQLKQAHWNVKGPHFIRLHELFDKVAEELEELTDDMAERAVELGGLALGTIQSRLSSLYIGPGLRTETRRCIIQRAGKLWREHSTRN